MAKSDKKKQGYRKLLDMWAPPEGCGDAIGCVATTYTFSPEFYEEECLSRFLQLQTTPDDDGAAYIIEREEKLASLRCASVLVDASHCRGSRSLRWDLLPARVPGSILHAKVTLLHWSNRVRLLVASANVTEDGYRRNLEVFGVLDYMDGGNAPLECLDSALQFLSGVVEYSEGENAGEGEPSPAVRRWREFLDGVSEVSREWGSAAEYRGKKQVRVYPVFVGPGGKSVFEQFWTHWPIQRPPDDAYVCSPFFDPPGAPNRPAQELWRNIRLKGKASVTFNLSAEDAEDGKLQVRAPRDILKAQPKGRSAVRTYLCRVKQFEEGDDSGFRPLHAKCMSFEGADWSGHIMGSSNFTSAGLGVGKSPNIEANLLYLVSYSANRSSYERVWNGLPQGEAIPEDVELIWQPEGEEGEDSPSGEVQALPPAFGQAVFVQSGGSSRVELSINGNPPSGWAILKDDGKVIFDEVAWDALGREAQIRIDWPEDRPPSGFEVTWVGAEGSAWWPVNVDRQSSLPPPEELKNLPLDVLVDILTSARPLHLAMRSWLRRSKGGASGGDNGPIVDPHAKVDTSAFLIQRTRRLAWGLNALRERLERPVASQDALEWRLRGPVGAMALAKAVEREAGGRTSEGDGGAETSFLLAELALELSRVKPRTAPGYLPVQEVEEAIDSVVVELEIMASGSAGNAPDSIGSYVHAAFREALK